MKLARLRIPALVAATLFFIQLALAQTPQKLTSPTPAEMQQRMDALKKQLDEDEIKAKSTAIDAEYAQRIQKQSETYYEKVLSTQMWTLGIMGFILTAVFGLAAKFSLDIFERRTQDAVNQAKTQLRKEYSDAIVSEVKILKDANASDIGALSESLNRKIDKTSEDLQIRSDFNFRLARAYAAHADERFENAKKNFREALRIYKDQKFRTMISTNEAAILVGNIFEAIKVPSGTKYLDGIKNELKDTLYDGLDDVLAQTALSHSEYADLIRERRTATTATTKSEPASSPGASPARRAIAPAKPAVEKDPE